MVRFLKGDVRACPYYQSDDEFKIVRKTDIVVISSKIMGNRFHSTW